MSWLGERSDKEGPVCERWRNSRDEATETLLLFSPDPETASRPAGPSWPLTAFEVHRARHGAASMSLSLMFSWLGGFQAASWAGQGAGHR